MKKQSFLLVCVCLAFPAIMHAQVLTIHDPGKAVTVSNSQISGWAGQVQADAAMFLTFEGLGNLEPVSRYYDGGKSQPGLTGPDHGISFSGASVALIDAGNGGSGNFTRETSPNTIMTFLSGCDVILNVPAGFSGELSFVYSTASGIVVSVFDGPDASGTLLGSMSGQPLTQGMAGNAGVYYDNWKKGRVAFSGTAKSVQFLGVANQCGFDDIFLGSGAGEKSLQPVISGGTATKEKSSFLTTATTAKESTEKGRFFLGGASRLDFSIGGYKSKSGGEVNEDSKTKYFDFNFIPKAGYFVIDNLVAGLFLDAELYSEKPKNDDAIYYYREKESTFIIGPFVRYYVPICDRMIPYAEAQVGFGSDNYSYKYDVEGDWTESKYSIFNYSVGVGSTYFFNNSVGADMFLGYQHDSYKYKDSDNGGEKSSDSKSIYGQLTVKLGIVVILGK
jgi:hypothetical protein